MRLPCERFLTAVLLDVRNANPKGSEKDHVNELFARTRAYGIEFPPGFDISSFYKNASQYSVKDASSLRLSDYFSKDKTFVEMLSAITDVRIRRDLELLTLGTVPPDRIAENLTKKHNKFITETMVKDYQHYFFDISLLTLEDIEVWAGMQANADRFLMALNSPELSQQIVGIKIDFAMEDILADIKQEIGYAVARTRKSDVDLKTRVNILKTLANTVKTLDDTIRSRPGGTKDILTELKDSVKIHQEDNEESITLPELLSREGAGNEH